MAGAGSGHCQPGTLNHPETLAQADLQDLCLLLTTHARTWAWVVRFCAGHLPEMVECDHITRLLQRLQESGDLDLSDQLERDWRWYRDGENSNHGCWLKADANEFLQTPLFRSSAGRHEA